MALVVSLYHSNIGDGLVLVGVNPAPQIVLQDDTIGWGGLLIDDFDNRRELGKLDKNDQALLQLNSMDGTTVSGETEILGSKISGGLSAKSAIFSGGVSIDKLATTGPFSFSGKFASDTKITDSEFPDGLSFNNSTFSEKFLLDSDHICFGTKDCVLSFNGTSFEDGLYINDSEIDGIVDAEGVDVAHSITLTGDGDTATPLYLYLADSEDIKPDVIIKQSTLGLLDLGESTISKTLNLANDSWATNGSFDFSDGSVGTIRNPSWNWPSPGNVNIAGLAFDSIDHGDVPLDRQGCIGGGWVKWFTPYQPIDSKGHFWRRLAIWLRLEPSFTDLQYTAQPYEDLAKMLKNTGDASQATCVLESSADIQNSRNHGLYHLLVWLYGLFDGFGYNPARAAWSLAMVPLGMIVLWLTREGKRLEMSVPIRFFYSLSTFIPLVSLDKQFDDIKL